MNKDLQIAKKTVQTEIQALKKLLSSFNGSSNFSKKLLDLGAYISLSGIITFKNANELQDTFKSLPLDKILIETDSPFLAPIPMRGKKNEPSYIKYTLERLAEIKNLSSAAGASIVTWKRVLSVVFLRIFMSGMGFTNNYKGWSDEDHVR